MRFLPSLALLVLSPLSAQIIPGRYIVELTSEPVARAMTRQSAGRPNLRGISAATHRARVHAQQGEVQAKVEGLSATVRGRVSTVANALIVDASEEQIAKLAALDGVKKIHPVRRFKRVLDRAVSVHKAVEAWDQLGGKMNAGAGIKVGVLDTGIEYDAAAFANSGLAVPDGFPLYDTTTDKKYTNAKIIVARSYVNYLDYRDVDYTIRDHVGHGTFLAAIIAGMETKAPSATIAGFAPAAQIGVYKIFGTPGYNDDANDAAILAALDDAVADGMDVVNLSFGTVYAERIADDVEVAAVQAATDAGVIVVIAAGNAGSDLSTMSSPGTAPTAITVGATTNSRVFATNVSLSNGTGYAAVTTNSAYSPLTGTVVGVGGDGLGCGSQDAGTFTGKIVVIERGTCTFENKINYAAAAGAAGVVIYTADAATDPFTMTVGTATLPAMMVGYNDGVAILSAIASDSTVTATMNFTASAMPSTPNRVTSFTSCGPNVDNSIKPDLMAVGQDYYSATQTLDGYGDMYDSSGYLVANGTSFSTPTVAGAAALIKGARPGLTVDQYRSLLINSAADAVINADGTVPLIQRSGAGLLDVSAALNSPLAVSPVSIGLGSGATTISTTTSVTLTNLSGVDDTFTLAATARQGGLLPTFDATPIALAAGASTTITLTWKGADLTVGPQEGVVTATATSSGRSVRVPYWYAASTSTPARIVVLDAVTSARRGATTQDAVVFRIIDASGVILTDVTPSVSVISGSSATGIYSYDTYYPGIYALDIRIAGGGPGGGGYSSSTTVVYRIQAGDVYVDVSVIGR
jgi:subtilisin family serine protease